MEDAAQVAVREWLVTVKMEERDGEIHFRSASMPENDKAFR